MLPDTSFRSLFLLTGMTTCGCYSQPEDTEMPLLALFGPGGPASPCPLFGEDRK
jgi:hypothetical protein